MKAIFILPAVILFHLVTNAQTMVDTGKVWNVAGCLNFGTCGTTNYSFGGDTTIGINQYKLLIIDNDSGFVSFYEPLALREDTVAKQVFFYRLNSEALVYDFSLGQGSSYMTSLSGCSINIAVDSVDSIALLNGELRKRMMVTITSFNCFGISYTETWIEGIGSLMGLTQVGLYVYMVDVYPELICFHENDTLKYHDTQYSSCFFSTVGVSDYAPKNLFKIFPNPTTGFISIRSDNSEEVKSVIISNVFGETLLATDKIEIDLSGFKPGIYFVQTRTDSRNYTAKVLRR